MANTDYIDLFKDVLPDLASDPSDPATEAAIRRTVIELCSKSMVWQAQLAAINTVVAQSFYAITPPADADIAGLVSVNHNGTPLEPKDVAWLNANMPNWRTDTGSPQFYTQIEIDSVLLARAPDTIAPLNMLVALQPTSQAAGAPAWLMRRYRYAIADGACAHLMLMANKPWTDLANGQDRRTKFENALANARAEAVSAFGSAPTRTTSQH